MDKKNVSWVKRQCDDTTRLEPRPLEQKHDDHTTSPQGTHNLKDSLCFSVVKESLTRTSFARSDWSQQNTTQTNETCSTSERIRRRMREHLGASIPWISWCAWPSVFALKMNRNKNWSLKVCAKMWTRVNDSSVTTHTASWTRTDRYGNVIM